MDSASGKMLADVLQELHIQKKTGALYVSVAEQSENLIRFYLRDGEIYHLCYGPAKDTECLDIIECYTLTKTIFFEGFNAPSKQTGKLPNTTAIIDMIKRMNKTVLTTHVTAG